MISVTVRSRPDRENLQLAYTEPATGRLRTKSAGTSDWDAAQRAAAKWEMELRASNGEIAMPWGVFRDRFTDEHLATLAPTTRKNFFYGLNKFEKLMGSPRDVAMINANMVSQYAAKLRKDVNSESSVSSNLMVLRTALGWAAGVGIIKSAPKIRVQQIGSRGRPISLSEFIGMMQRIKTVSHPHEVPSLRRLLLVMWLGGLRIGEALRLSVDSGPVRVDLHSGRRPAIAWHKGGQKNRKIERSPIAVDFARYLSRFKSGPIVNAPIARKTISTRISDAGLGITSHDLRRTFGTRWALRVHPFVLKAMMRHASLETTEKYYVDLDTDTLADQIWSGVHADVHEARVPTPNSDIRQSKNQRF